MVPPTDTMQASDAPAAGGVIGSVGMEGAMAVITGTNNSETLNGTAGDDTIKALAGHDTLFGDLGLDILNGGNGNDRFEITAQAQIVAGETYNGGLGFDTLFLNAAGAIDISSTIITDVEALLSFGEVSLTAAQLDGFV